MHLVKRLALLTVITPLWSCATATVYQAPTLRLSEFTHIYNNSGVVIAADPYFEGSRVKSLFGADIFTEYGVLPVRMIIENHGADEPFLVEVARIRLLDKDGRELSLAFSAREVIRQQEREAANAHSSVVKAGVLFPPFVFLSLLSAKGMSDVNAIKYNMSDKSLYDKMYSKNDSSQGFVYFALGESNRGQLASVVEVTITFPSALGTTAQTALVHIRE